MEDTVLLGFFMTIQKRVEMLDSAPAGPETLGASLPTEGGILRRRGRLLLLLPLSLRDHIQRDHGDYHNRF